MGWFKNFNRKCSERLNKYTEINWYNITGGPAIIQLKGTTMPKIFKNIFFIGFLSILNLVSVSQSQNIVNPDIALQKILNELEGEELTLGQAQEYAKKNSTSFKLAEATYLASLGTLRRERGNFDPLFFLNLNYNDQKVPAASFFSGASVLSTQKFNASTGLRLNLPIGTELELSINSSRLKTNSQFAFLNPEYDAFGSISLRQPLLAGFMSSSRKDLKQAELNNESAKAQFDQEFLALRTSVENSYWTLYATERDYAVQKLTLERAESLLKEAQLREKAGLVGPNQVANAKTFWAEQKLLMLDREEQLDTQSDQFAVLIGKRPDPGNTRFVTIDNPPDDFPSASVEDLVEHTLDNNLDLKAAKKQIEISEALIDAANWKMLPQVDLVGSITSNALGGSSQDVVFGGDTLRSTNNGSFGDVLSEIFRRNYPGWSIGVEVTVPIGLRSGLGEKDRLEAVSYSTKQNYTELSRILEQKVRTSYRQLIHGNERLKVSREGVDAAQEQVRIGMIEFKNGRLSAFELVRLSEDFAVAQQRYSDALVKTVKAASDLKQLTSGYYPVSEKQ
jgi:outer membrane protein TolC